MITACSQGSHSSREDKNRRKAREVEIRSPNSDARVETTEAEDCRCGAWLVVEAVVIVDQRGIGVDGWRKSCLAHMDADSLEENWEFIR